MAQSERSLPLGILSCFGGLFIHLIIGAYFQWGFINVYVTSYYKITEPNLTLESNGIVFPLMQLCIAPTMKAGTVLAEKFGAFPTLIVVEILIAGVVFGSSYLPTFLSFIFVFGMGIGALAGLTFLIPLIECNKYIQGKRMHVNGVILTGTGLGSLIFGQFVYNYLNPQRIPSNDGYYDEDLLYIAEKVPESLRWLSLLYLCIGVAGAFMMLPVIRRNKVIQEELTEQNHGLEDPLVCPTMCESLKTKVFYAKSYIIIFAVCGDLLLNGNFKTYVQKQITDDNYLTLIGSVGAIGNAFCRFLWNMVFNKIGYRKTLAIICAINVVVFVTIRYTVHIKELYCFEIFLANSCLGGFLVLNITHSHIVFGIDVGSNLDLFYWSFFSFSNFIGYFYVSGLSSTIGFNNIFYICLAMNVSVYPLLYCFHFQSKWSFAQQGIVNEDSEPVLQAHKEYVKKLQAYARGEDPDQTPEHDQNSDHIIRREGDDEGVGQENEGSKNKMQSNEGDSPSKSKMGRPSKLPPINLFSNSKIANESQIKELVNEENQSDKKSEKSIGKVAERKQSLHFQENEVKEE